MATELQSMDRHQQRYNWREKTVQLSWKLDSAHCALEDLGHALDAGDRAAARHIVRSAHEAVGSVGLAVKTLRTEQPPTEQLEQPDAIGSALAIGGSGVATIALDVMVNAMVALAATQDRDETDFLIGACLDAETAYEVERGGGPGRAPPRRPGHARPATRVRHRRFGGPAPTRGGDAATRARHQRAGGGTGAGLLSRAG